MMGAEAFWAADRGEWTPAWLQEYEASITRPYRQQIVDAIVALQATSLLEVGCHCGPNLRRIAKACPSMRLLGVDVNRTAVDAGKAAVVRDGFADRVTLYHAAFPRQTYGLEDGCVDVVLTCYALAYLAPRDLPEALSEAGRIARRAVVLVEPMAVNGLTPAGVRTLDYEEWRHDYPAAIAWVQTLAGSRHRMARLDPPADRLNAMLILEKD